MSHRARSDARTLREHRNEHKFVPSAWGGAGKVASRPKKPGELRRLPATSPGRSWLQLSGRLSLSGFQNNLHAAIQLLFEDLICIGRLGKREYMSYNKGWVDLSIFDFLEKQLHIPVDMSLTHFQS